MYLKIEALQTLDAETCALIAQVLPVFWLVLVVPGGPLKWQNRTRRESAPVVLILLFLSAAEGVALYGAGHGGLSGYLAQATWTGALVSIAALAVGQIAEVVRGSKGQE